MGVNMRTEFNNKAKDYSKGRPTYPVEILEKLRELGIDEKSSIADVGAGTGLLTNILCRLGGKVFVVEPNLEMLSECRNYCNYDNIEFILATAENTTLEENSVDAITVAQAFHWFDRKLCRAEFKRILKENGYVLTVWNSREEDDDFTREYVNIIHGCEFKTTAGNSYFDPHKEKLEFFGQEYQKVVYDNYQSVDLDGLLSNAASISFTPSRDDEMYSEFAEKLTNLFNKYENNGVVTFHYTTEVCIGQFAD